GKIGQIGPLDRDINGTNSDGSIRGPFKIALVESTSPSTYPVLWAHKTEREHTLQFLHDSEGRPRQGRDAAQRAEVAKRIEAVWKSASHCHFNRDFRFNSQSTAMQLTPQKAIGGRAWPSVTLASVDLE